MATITKSNYNTNEQPFHLAIRSEAYTKLINETLGDKETAKKFVADLMTMYSTNYALSKCTTGTILSAGLQAQRLNLPLTNGLGYVYVVPYGNKAQFLISYKGLIQLAQRSGQFERLGVKEVHRGELKGYDEFGDEIIEFNHDFDNNEVIGYFAYFKLLNGFKKTLYWTKGQVENHARKYSKSYGNGSSTDLWGQQFDLMACKTVLKQLLSKFAPLSVEMITAIQSDQAVIKEDGKYEYVDNLKEETPTPQIEENTTENEEVENADIFDI